MNAVAGDLLGVEHDVRGQVEDRALGLGVVGRVAVLDADDVRLLLGRDAQPVGDDLVLGDAVQAVADLRRLEDQQSFVGWSHRGRLPRGRPRAFDADVVLQAALELFWKHGYQATTTRDLERALGLSQSSLYNAFGSKQDLLTAALGRYETLIDAELLAPLESLRADRRGGADADRPR